MAAEISTVAVVGSGIIGRSWIRVFTRAGLRTRVYEPDAAQLDDALEWVRTSLRDDERAGLLAPGRVEIEMALIQRAPSLTEALRGAGYVQESGPEDLGLKQRIFEDLDQAADPHAILASSTSTLDMTAITADLPGADRCLVAHPVNPPHVIPAVEILPADRTDPACVERAMVFLRFVAQKPVRLRRYVPGFLLNRMQAALVREAINLVEAGVADVDAIDTVVRDGLGLRWSVLGPFGVGNTNADGGLREYYRRYGSAYRQLMNDLGPTPSLDSEMIERLVQGTDAMVGGISVAEMSQWRDRLICKIRMLKNSGSP